MDVRVTLMIVSWPHTCTRTWPNMWAANLSNRNRCAGKSGQILMILKYHPAGRVIISALTAAPHHHSSPW